MGVIQEPPKVLTDAHVAVVRELERRGLGVMNEIPFPPYTVDVYVPRFHCAIEIDGPQHGKTRDEKRDRRLVEEYDLPVFRVKAGEAKRPKKWLPALRDFLLSAAETADERRSECEQKASWL